MTLIGCAATVAVTAPASFGADASAGARPTLHVAGVDRSQNGVLVMNVPAPTAASHCEAHGLMPGPGMPAPLPVLPGREQLRISLHAQWKPTRIELSAEPAAPDSGPAVGTVPAHLVKRGNAWDVVGVLGLPEGADERLSLTVYRGTGCDRTLVVYNFHLLAAVS